LCYQHVNESAERNHRETQCSYGSYVGRTQNGEPCKRCIKQGGLCWQHVGQIPPSFGDCSNRTSSSTKQSTRDSANFDKDPYRHQTERGDCNSTRKSKPKGTTSDSQYPSKPSSSSNFHSSSHYNTGTWHSGASTTRSSPPFHDWTGASSSDYSGRFGGGSSSSPQSSGPYGTRFSSGNTNRACPTGHPSFFGNPNNTKQGTDPFAKSHHSKRRNNSSGQRPSSSDSKSNTYTSANGYKFSSQQNNGGFRSAPNGTRATGGAYTRSSTSSSSRDRDDTSSSSQNNNNTRSTPKHSTTPTQNKHFAVLGVDGNNPSYSEVRNAWRKLVLQFHPDKNPGSEVKFCEVQEAWEAVRHILKK
jgi:hypothetical protein